MRRTLGPRNGRLPRGAPVAPGAAGPPVPYLDLCGSRVPDPPLPGAPRHREEIRARLPNRFLPLVFCLSSSLVSQK